MKELKIKIIGEDRKYEKDEVIYEKISLEEDDLLLQALVEKAKKEFGLEIERINLTLKSVWQ